MSPRDRLGEDDMLAAELLARMRLAGSWSAPSYHTVGIQWYAERWSDLRVLEEA